MLQVLHPLTRLAVAGVELQAGMLSHQYQVVEAVWDDR